MENLRIFINSNDIKKYLLSHKDDKNLKYKVIKEAIYRLRNYSKEYYNSMNKIDYPIKEIGIFNDTLGRYVKLRTLGLINFTGKDFSLIGKDRCEKELEIYSQIFGTEPVSIIREYVKNLKK